MAPTGGGGGITSVSSAGGGNIKVVVRVRPFNNRELDRRAKCVVQMKDGQTILQSPAETDRKVAASLQGTKTFKYDRSYWSFDKSDPNYAGQENVFTDLGVPLLDNAFQGYNNCIFAYGQTGSGKSYSMMGYGEESGVIPRICRDMFERIDKIHSDPNLKCTVEVSYLEIYNEKVRDLLNPTTKGNLRVREHPSTGPYVEDLAKLAVRSFIEIENLMDEGNKARTVAATNMNETSSRSHAVFTLILTQKRHDVETRMNTEKVAKISLVDLAGSERATSTGATGARLKEGAEINRSLSTLGRVIAALADLSTGKKSIKVPYRDSILTWLLKDSLGGNSLTAMIAAISPADINFEETLSTLRYADSAKRIKNHAVVNEDPNARMIRELKEELAQLRSKLGSGAVVGGTPGESYPEGTPLEKQMVSIIQSDGSVKQMSKAEILEQLNQSEKLYTDLNQTWEEKLLRTEEIHKEREAALEELGISIEKGNVGMSTPKKMPHLVNLSDDPLLAECLVYNLKPGITTVGNVDAAVSAEIRLNGSRILEEHCKLENVDNVVNILPSEGAAIMVNGVRVDKPRRLKSGNRIILGDFHIFRFNNPLEAKAERAEQSLLRHSVTAAQMTTPVPFRPSHDRTMSRTISDFDGDSSRAESPLQRGRDSDWLLARREAAGALLGLDPKITAMTDDELDQLLENVQRAREERRGRPDSRLFDQDDSSDDLSSFLVRDRYMSGGTIDNFSLDTALTMPGTPLADGMSEYASQTPSHDGRTVKEVSQQPQTEPIPEAPSGEKLQAEEREKQQQEQAEMMRQELERTKKEFAQEMQRQKQQYEAQIKSMTPQRRIGPGDYDQLTAAEKARARIVVENWRQSNYIRIAEAILQNAGTLKEAQVMSKLLDQNVSFQFVILDTGEERVSSYDLILHDIADEDNDTLADSKKPCLAVRIIDFKTTHVHLWSLDKLMTRLSKMRQMQQYKEQPEYLQHFRLDNPFTDSGQGLFSLIGTGSIPLTAAFETRVQDFVVDVISPFTRQTIGRVRMSLEPSLAEAPLGVIKFNIVMRDLNGFAEHEGTSVHAQMFVSGSTDDSVATTQTVADFNDGPIRFESIHTLSVSQASEKSSMLKITVYAQVSSMHVDKLLSWDDIRETVDDPQQSRTATHRLPESEYNTEERHDVFAKVQMLELNESGQYVPIEVLQTSEADAGTYQLHQGLQRRISISLTHSLTESLPWDDIKNLRVGEIHLIGPSGRVADVGTTTPDINLRQIQEPMIKDNTDGTSNVSFIGQWDSSLHKSLLLDRATNEQCKIRICVRWDIVSSRLEKTMAFSIEQHLQILPRSHLRPQSILKSFWTSTRVTRSTYGLFGILVRPVSAKRAADLWRLDTSKEYVNGEEMLGNWQPRGISLVKDYITARSKRRQLEEIEVVKATHGLRRLNLYGNNGPISPTTESESLSERQLQLLNKMVSLWKKPLSNMSNPIFDATEMIEQQPQPQDLERARSPSTEPPRKIRYTATVTFVPKNATSQKSGYLLMPSESYDPSFKYMQWKRRFVDLRPPYLHIHSVPDGDAINAINLSHARIDHDPDFKMLLGGASAIVDVEDGFGTPVKRAGGGGSGGGIGSNNNNNNNSPARHKRAGSELSQGLGHVFAVYGEQNTFLFAARNDMVKAEWIFKIDAAFSRHEDDNGSDER